MSAESTPIAETPEAPTSSEPVIDRAWDAFEKEDSAQIAAASAPKTPAPAPSQQQAAQPASPAAAPAAGSLTYKFNHKEESIAPADFADPEKSKQIREWIEMGRGHKTVLERETGSAYVKGQSELAQFVRKSGIQFKPKVAEPKSLDDYEVVLPQVAMPAAAAADDPLAKEIAALEAKAKDGTATAEDLVKLPRLERQREAAQAKSEADRAAQEARRTREKQEIETAADDALFPAIEGYAKDFEGAEDAVANPVRSIIWKMARSAALEKGGSKDEVATNAKAFATTLRNHLVGWVNARVKHLTATATPPASPVIGGAPAGASSNGAASKGRASMQNADWLDSALDEAEAAGASRRR